MDKNENHPQDVRENQEADQEIVEQESKASFAEKPKRRYAGFWMRFWAYIVDLIVVFSISGILIKPFTIMDSFREASVGFWTWSGLLSGVIFFAYFLLMTKWRGQTLGKMIFGLRVIRENGEKPGWLDLIIREIVARFIYRVFWFMPILYVVVAFTGEKQGIHDLFADTAVIHE